LTIRTGEGPEYSISNMRLFFLRSGIAATGSGNWTTGIFEIEFMKMRKILGKNLRAFTRGLLFVCLIALLFGIWRSVGYEDAAGHRVAVKTVTSQGPKTPKEHSVANGSAEIFTTQTSLDRASASPASDVRLRTTAVVPSPAQKPVQVAATTVPSQVDSMPAGQVSPSQEPIAAPVEAKPAPHAHKPVQIAALTVPLPVKSITIAQASSPAPVEAKPVAVGIKPPSPVSRNVSVELTADKTSPVPAATVGNVIFTAHPRGESGKCEYKFWLKGPSTGNTWKVVQDFGAVASYAWIPAMPGSYVIWVYSRDASSPAGPEASAWMRFDVLDDSPVASVEVTADKTSPALRTKMGRVTFTPHAAGGSGRYEYKFWLRGPSTGNSWRVAQDYGISDSFTWAPTQAGHYLLWIYARNAGSPAAREAAAWTSFDVVDNQPVGSLELGADRKSPLPLPTDGITFTASAAGGSGKYEYEFWLKGPSTGNAWKVVQDYSVSNAFLWTPGQVGDYSIAVYARNEGSPAGHERIAGLIFAITGK
jgi:cytoskeletal protein RodZ